MNYEELQILTQLLKAMEEAADKMEKAYLKRNIESFKEAQGEVLNFQKKISELLANVKGQEGR